MTHCPKIARRKRLLTGALLWIASTFAQSNGGYSGAYRIAKPEPPAAFPDFREFVIEAVQSTRVRGRVVLGDRKGDLSFAAGSLYAGRLQFTTVRSPQGVSYSFQGDLLTQPPNAQTAAAVLEGTLRSHRYGAVKAAGKFLFTFRPAQAN